MKNAFTILEVLTTIGLISILAFLAVPYAASQLTTNRLYNTAAEMTSKIFEYQQSSYAFTNSKRYGFKINEDNYQVFISDDGVFDDPGDVIQQQNFPKGVTADSILGTNPLVFLESSFRPISTLSFRLNHGGVALTIEINSEGLINYYVD